MKKKYKYIAKPNTWFAAGTECILIDDYRPQWGAGLFSGLRICENPDAEGGIPVGAHRIDDEEICGFDEFDVVETEDENE